MGIHVNIAEAKARLSELVAASLRGEEVILQRAGKPLARITPLAEAMESDEDRRARIGAQRRAAVGMFKQEWAGADLSLAALKSDRVDVDERFERKFDPAA